MLRVSSTNPKMWCAALSKSLQRCVGAKDAKHETLPNQIQPAVRFRDWMSLCFSFQYIVQLNCTFRNPCHKQIQILVDFCCMFYLQIFAPFLGGQISTFFRVLSCFGMWSYGNAEKEKYRETITEFHTSSQIIHFTVIGFSMIFHYKPT